MRKRGEEVGELSLLCLFLEPVARITCYFLDLPDGATSFRGPNQECRVSLAESS